MAEIADIGNFNTSHVSINLRQSGIAKEFYEFQYISCFY